MNIFVTGANGYIGSRLIPKLVEAGHHVYALVRSKNRFYVDPKIQERVSVIEADLLDQDSLEQIPMEIDAAYYLVHSMSQSAERFSELEAVSAQNFISALNTTQAKQIIYLSGLVGDHHLSRHLASRQNVDKILRTSHIPVTTLMAGIVIGSGSASFEIIRDLVEKLPVMVAPKWINNLTQPIAIRDVLDDLLFVLGQPQCLGEAFEIGGPDVLTYKELLLKFAQIRGLKRKIFLVPVLTPRLSSYWLYFITSASFPLARALVESLKNNAICYDHRLQTLYPKKRLTYEEAVKKALDVIEENKVPSSWKDAIGDSRLNPDLSVYVKVPEYGVISETIVVPFKDSFEKVQDSVWALGGDRGWLFMNWAWRLRGMADKIVGGVGLRRGRTHPTNVRPGDALDFWRVIVADKEHHRLLLYAEMRLPGEAWLEFNIQKTAEGGILTQKATFRPHGVLGRLYWYLLYPLHWVIFRGMARRIVGDCL